MKNNKRLDLSILKHNIRTELTKKNLGQPNNYEELLKQLPVKKKRTPKIKPSTKKNDEVVVDHIKKYKKKKPNYRRILVKERDIKDIGRDINYTRREIEKSKEKIDMLSDNIDALVQSNEHRILKWYENKLWHLIQERRAFCASKSYTLPLIYKHKPKPKSPPKAKKEPIYVSVASTDTSFKSPYNVEVPQRINDVYSVSSPAINPEAPPDILDEIKKIEKKLIHGRANDFDKLMKRYNYLKETYILPSLKL